jgi:hypothetical protein
VLQAFPHLANGRYQARKGLTDIGASCTRRIPSGRILTGYLKEEMASQEEDSTGTFVTGFLILDHI